MQTLQRRERQVMGRKKPPGIRLAVEFDRQDRSVIVSVSHVDQIPLDFALLVGDIVHSYRSALDQLVFELAFMDTGGRECEKTQFPASDSYTNFTNPHVQNTLLGGLTKTHKALVKRFQPYRGWNGPGPHPMRFLHDLSNDDKHRLTQPALICPATIELGFDPEGTVNCGIDLSRELAAANVVGRPFEPDTEVFRAPLLFYGPKPQVKVQGQMTAFVGFRNGLHVIDSLDEIGRYAREIVNFFAPLFERPKSLRQRKLPRFGRIQPAAPRSGATLEASFFRFDPRPHVSPSKG